MAPENGTMQGFFRLTDVEKTSSSSFSPFAKRPEESSFTSAIAELKPWEEKEAYHSIGMLCRGRKGHLIFHQHAQVLSRAPVTEHQSRNFSAESVASR